MPGFWWNKVATIVVPMYETEPRDMEHVVQFGYLFLKKSVFCFN